MYKGADMKTGLAMIAFALGLFVTPVDAQILERLKDAVTGPPTQADIAAARQEVQASAQQALSALYAITPVSYTHLTLPTILLV